MIEEFIGTFKFKLQVLVTRYQIEYSAVIIWHSLFQSFLPIFFWQILLEKTGGHLDESNKCWYTSVGFFLKSIA